VPEVVEPERGKLRLLQHAPPRLRHDLEELDLHLGRHLSELVEEQGPAVGDLEEARLVADRAGESAPLVAEQLVLQEVVGDRAAVDVHEELLPAPAQLVDRAREEALARSRLAQEHDPGIGGRRLLDALERGADRRALADDVGQALRDEDAPERRVLPPEPEVLDGPPEGVLDEQRLGGLAEVMEGAPFMASTQSS
jgi:hypothetical protein